jgi:hypothetical protein
MGKAGVATGRVPILSASVKKQDKENWKTISTSQFEAMLTLGKGAGNHIVCHKVEAQKDMGKTREVEAQKDMGKPREAKPNDQSCPTDDRLCVFPCNLAQGNKDERQRKEPWNLQESRAMTSWETGVCWRYMPYDSRPNESDFRNEKDHGYRKSLGLLKVASATSTRLVTSEPAWLTKVSGATGESNQRNPCVQAHTLNH